MRRMQGLVLAGLVSGCASLSGGEGWKAARNEQTGKSETGKNESELLYSVVREVAAGQSKEKEPGQVLLVQETMPVSKRKSLTFPQDFAGMHRYLPQVSKACVTDFLQANKLRYEVPARDEPDVAVKTAGISRVNQLLQSGGWRALVAAYPHTSALVSVARPGVCGDHREALLYLLSTRGDGGADGILVYAKRDGDEWHVAKQVVISRADAEE